MQYQPDIHTISKTAPPSYAEAMAQSAPVGDNTYVPTSGQPTMYDQSRPQMSGYPSSTPAYQHPSNFYSNISAQPPYNPTYVPVESSQQSHTAMVATPCIVHADPSFTLGPREEKTFCERCATCNKKVVIALIATILSLYLIKVIVSRAI